MAALKPLPIIAFALTLALALLLPLPSYGAAILSAQSDPDDPQAAD